ncbi:phage tail tape measure protein [Brucella sp. 6810]|uniref:tape measure protein n=1 Tax=Brucella sp. 6810 TaxID=2769351 RepID=UPI00165B4BB1|nr:tape measure protein [Brucella sp. 6810]QNQ62241.1 phage tail tape measure protein [Brucella sp. 6810]
MTVQLSSLRVVAGLDAGNYVSNMNQKVAADRAGSESSRAVGAAVTQTEQKISTAGNSIERLSRQYVDGYASSSRFNAAISSLGKGVERGAVPMERADQILEGIYKKFGLTADATELAEKGYVSLARSVDNLNGKLAMQAAANDNFGVTAANVSQKVDAQTGSNERLTTSLGSLIDRLKTAAGAMGVFLSLRGLQTTVDTWSDLNARVNIAVGSVDKGAAVMERLESVARRTYSSLNTTVDSYIANSGALRELGYSTKQQLDYTEALNNALVVSNTKGQQAESVQTALSKALALGKLKGDELNTVLSTGGRVAEAIAAKLGVTTLELRKLGAQGKLTGDVLVNSLISQLGKLRDEADSMPATIGDAFTLIANSFLQTIGVFDQANNLSGRLAETLVLLADNMDRVVAYAVAAGTAFAIMYVGSLLRAVTVTVAFERSLLALRATLLRTGVGVLVVALGELIHLLVQARQNTDSWSAAWQRFGQAFSMGIYALQTVFRGLVLSLRGMWEEFLAFMLQSTSEALSNFGVSFDVSEQVKSLQSAARQSREGAKIRFEDAGEAFRQAYAQINSKGAGPDLSGDGGLGAKLTEVDKAVAKARKAYEDLMLTAKGRVDQMKLEAETAGLTGIAQDTLRFKLELLQEVEKKRLNLSAAQRKTLLDQVDAYEKYATAAAKAKLQQDLLFERQQMGRSSIDQTIASALQGAGLPIDLNSFEAGLIRTNEQLKITKEQFGDTFRGFFSDLSNGTKVLDALFNGLSRIADKLIEMAADNLASAAFGGLFGGGGGGFLGGLFGGGGGTGYFPPAPSMSGGLYAKGGVFSSGLSSFSGNFTNQVVSRPTMFAFAKGVGLMGEAGPEAIMPLSRGADGRLGVQNFGSGASRSGSPAEESRTVVRVDLGPDLVGQILEQSGKQTVSIVQRRDKEMQSARRNGVS